MIKTFLKGAAMGIAEVIPGISGGTVATVPPDIPGMTSAIPIAAPFKKVLIIKPKSGYYTFKEGNEQNIF